MMTYFVNHRIWRKVGMRCGNSEWSGPPWLIVTYSYQKPHKQYAAKLLLCHHLQCYYTDRKDKNFVVVWAVIVIFFCISHGIQTQNCFCDSLPSNDDRNPELKSVCHRRFPPLLMDIKTTCLSFNHVHVRPFQPKLGAAWWSVKSVHWGHTHPHFFAEILRNVWKPFCSTKNEMPSRAVGRQQGILLTFFLRLFFFEFFPNSLPMARS